MNERVYSPEDQDLIYEWSYNWLQLIELINNITGTDQAPWSPPVPTELDELEYQRLRFWLIDHQARFTPLWREFYQSHDWAITQSNAAKEGDLPQRYLENHFLCFYEPENLYRLVRQLELQIGIGIWEPSENLARMMRPLLIRLGQLMIEFMDWIDEQARSPGIKILCMDVGYSDAMTEFRFPCLGQAEAGTAGPCQPPQWKGSSRGST